MYGLYHAWLLASQSRIRDVRAALWEGSPDREPSVGRFLLGEGLQVLLAGGLVVAALTELS